MAALLAVGTSVGALYLWKIQVCNDQMGIVCNNNDQDGAYDTMIPLLNKSSSNVTPNVDFIDSVCNKNMKSYLYALIPITTWPIMHVAMSWVAPQFINNTLSRNHDRKETETPFRINKECMVQLAVADVQRVIRTYTHLPSSFIPQENELSFAVMSFKRELEMTSPVVSCTFNSTTPTAHGDPKLLLCSYDGDLRKYGSEIFQLNQKILDLPTDSRVDEYKLHTVSSTLPPTNHISTKLTENMLSSVNGTHKRISDVSVSTETEDELSSMEEESPRMVPPIPSPSPVPTRHKLPYVLENNASYGNHTDIDTSGDKYNMKREDSFSNLDSDNNMIRNSYIDSMNTSQDSGGNTMLPSSTDVRRRAVSFKDSNEVFDVVEPSTLRSSYDTSTISSGDRDNYDDHDDDGPNEMSGYGMLPLSPLAHPSLQSSDVIINITL